MLISFSLKILPPDRLYCYVCTYLHMKLSVQDLCLQLEADQTAYSDLDILKVHVRPTAVKSGHLNERI